MFVLSLNLALALDHLFLKCERCWTFMCIQGGFRESALRATLTRAPRTPLEPKSAYQFPLGS